VTRKTGATTTTTEVEAVEGEIRSMEGELAALESERAELDAPAEPPSWDELQRAGALEELEAQASRRGVLPRIIGAAREKLLDLRVRREEALLAPLKAERARAHAALEEAQAEARRAEEARGAAVGRWSVAHANVQGRERRVERATRELAELREGRR
jgi:chromosome segregation ATPase